jgi:hypothetical protein
MCFACAVRYPLSAPSSLGSFDTAFQSTAASRARIEALAPRQGGRNARLPYQMVPHAAPKLAGAIGA